MATKSHPPNAPHPAAGGDVTRLLSAWRQGSPDAERELWALLYSELKRLARGQLRKGRKRQGTTSLVHQAYLRLLGSDVEWSDRSHFFAVASRAMRFVLIDEARKQLADKRKAEVDSGPTPETGPILEVSDPTPHQPEELLAVHEALDRLREVNPRHERLVELRYFAGLTVEETAKVLGVTSRTVVRDWRSVRVWLHNALSAPPMSGDVSTGR